MDQQTDHDVLDVRTPGGGWRHGAEPYGLLGLAVSMIVIALIAILVAALIAGAILLGQLAWTGYAETRSFYLSLRFDIPTQAELNAFAVSVVYASLIGATVLVGRRRSPGAWRDLLALRTGEVAWRRTVSIVVMTLIYATLVSLVLDSLRQRRVPLDGPTDHLLIGLVTLNYIVLAPLAEELIFRGWVYTALRRRFRFGTCLFATSFLFAAIHWEPRHMVLVLPLAFALGFLREQTGSIKPTILLHASYNLIIVAIAFMLQ